jgi:hypothetical protein
VSASPQTGAGEVTQRGLRALLLLASLASPGAALGQGTNELEYAVKATYLYKFAPFVHWPENVLAAGASFDICVVGRDPFGALLDDAVRGEQVRGHPILVRRLPEISRGSGCEIVFAGGSSAQSIQEILDAVAGEPVLTVTDVALGRTANGIVHFVILDDRVRFEIDDRAAAENGLMISSKVLSLALAVRPRQ